MKNIILTLLICFATMNSNAMSFTIQGNIEGLMPGDTLYFEQITLPGWELNFAFKTIVEKPNEFIYNGSHEHIGYYIMTYKPASGKVTPSDRRGEVFLIKDGITYLSGTADQIYYLSIKGSLYDNEMLQSVMQFDNLLGKERGGLIRLLEEARVVGDTIKLREYSDKFNSFQNERREDFQKLSQLRTEFYEQYPSSYHTIVYALQRVNSTPFETLQSKYEKMNNEARNSYFGKIFKQEIDKIAVLLPGNDAPDFHLIGMDGREISLADCAGSYVLIYHWGICPGSFQVNNMVIDLYNKYKDHLIIIGVTDRIETIKNMYDNTQPDAKFMNLELKSVLANMLAHPWFDAERITGNNDKIATDYAFAGLPYFVFISPDGKIIERHFFNAFNTAKSTMESEFGVR
jgi:hypothetical protein